MKHRLFGQPMFGWWYQRIAALLLVGLLTIHIHFIKQRFWAAGTMRYDDMVATLRNPWCKVLEMLFLFFALSHGGIGVYGVCKQYWFFKSHPRVLKGLLWVVGCAMYCLAALIILPI